jgi:general secretion pathway protein K
MPRDEQARLTPPRPASRSRESGYALIAAITAVAAFAYIAYEVMASDRGAIIALGGQAERARLEAAADAGTVLAVHALGQSDPSTRWSIDGKVHEAEFAGMRLQISIRDERGKVPLDGLNPDQSRTFFEQGGASGDRVDALVDELRDFQSGEDERATNDETSQPVQTSYLAQVRQAGFRGVGDLMALKHMDVALYNRLAESSTVFFEESGPFEPLNADPLAKATMHTGEDVDTPDISSGGPDNSDDNPSDGPPDTPVDYNVVGRTVTVEVVAINARGAHDHRRSIVELTGNPSQTYWTRYAE